MERLRDEEIKIAFTVTPTRVLPVRHRLMFGCLAIHSLNCVNDCVLRLSSSRSSSFAISLNFGDSVHWYESYSSGLVSKFGMGRFSASNTAERRKTKVFLLISRLAEMLQWKQRASLRCWPGLKCRRLVHQSIDWIESRDSFIKKFEKVDATKDELSAN